MTIAQITSFRLSAAEVSSDLALILQRSPVIVPGKVATISSWFCCAEEVALRIVRIDLSIGLRVRVVTTPRFFPLFDVLGIVERPLFLQRHRLHAKLTLSWRPGSSANSGDTEGRFYIVCPTATLSTKISVHCPAGPIGSFLPPSGNWTRLLSFSPRAMGERSTIDLVINPRQAQR